jgi:hypothetical protein
MNTQTTPFSAHELPVPAVHEAGSPRLGYSAFRLDALALNADLASLNNPLWGGGEDVPVHWIMECEHLAGMIRAVGSDMKMLAHLRGERSGSMEQLTTNVIVTLNYAQTPRPEGGIAHLRFVIELTFRCIAKSFSLQASIAVASRHRNTTANVG